MWFYQNIKCPKALCFQGFPGTCKPVVIIPTRCRDLHLKQFCLEDIAPAILIILITHIVLAVRWMLIKILSAVINHHGTVKTVVSGGCHPNNNIIRKSAEKSRCCTDFQTTDPFWIALFFIIISS